MKIITQKYEKDIDMSDNMTVNLNLDIEENNGMINDMRMEYKNLLL